MSYCAVNLGLLSIYLLLNTVLKFKIFVHASKGCCNSRLNEIDLKCHVTLAVAVAEKLVY